MSETEAAPAAAGHNLPPTTSDEQAENIRTRIEAEHAWMIDRQKQLIEAVPRVPEEINADNVGQATDFIKQITAASKALNGARVSEKEPFLAAGRTIDGIFKNLTEPLKKAKETIQERVNIYLRAKEAAERARREEEAERLRIENERLRREAAEAEERRQREEQERQQAAKKAEEERLAEVARKEEEKLAEIETYRNDRRWRVQKRLDDGKIDQAHADRLIAQINERTERATAEADAMLDRALEQAEKASARDAEALAVQARKADRETKRDEKAIVRAAATVTKAEKAAEAPAADLARTRGEYGSVGTLQERWDYRVVDWPAVDLEALRPFLARDDIEKSIRAFINVNKGDRELAGVEIFPDLQGQTR